MRLQLSCLLLFICTAVFAFTQETELGKPTLGCHLDQENTNIAVHYERRPLLKLVQPSEPPRLGWYSDAKHTFKFYGNSAFTMIQFYFAATMPEELQGRASEAELLIYAKTLSPDPRNLHGAPEERWWQLTSPAHHPEDLDGTTALVFEAAKVAGCFNSNDESTCSFAQVALATPDPSIAIFDLSFSVDEGGANANNSTDSHILLDFRSEPPTVLASLECNNNEGGGACTAFDSGTATRSGLRCTWHSETSDFWCDEVQPLAGPYSRPAHDYFYLIRGDQAPPPSHSCMVDNLAQAAQRLDSVDGSCPISYVSHYGEVGFAMKTPKLLVLGSPGDKRTLFHFVPRRSKSPQNIVSLEPADVSLAEDSESRQRVLHNISGVTPEGTIRYKARQVYSGHHLQVYSVVAKEGNSHEVYWLGIEDSHGETYYDVLRIATEASYYSGCGRSLVPPAIVSTSKIEAPFYVRVQIQPEILVSDAEETVEFRGSDSDKPTRECVHSATVEWSGGHKFRLRAVSPCEKSGSARYVHISDEGDIELSEKASQ
jgi:hypothetical protein